MTKAAVGRQAPDFSLPTQMDKTLSLGDFKGQKLLIYFYPKDDTPGCTRQACALNSDLRQLSSLKLAVVGVSKDSVASHKKFAQKFNLKFPLLSDEHSDMCERYGVWVEKSMYGKKYKGIERSSFLIDEEGKIIAVWRKVSPDEHLAWVMGQLKNGLTGITNSMKSKKKPAAESAKGQQTPSGKVTTMALTKKKPAAKKATAAKKPAAKKPAAKKKTATKKATATKKPAAKKKTAAKKTSAKKATAKAATATKAAKKPAKRKPAAKKKAA